MATDFAQKVADRIRQLREERGYSLRELARRSELPPESVSRSERGITEITLTSLAKLCDGLRIDLPEFFSFAKRETKVSRSALRVMALVDRFGEARAAKVVKAIEVLLARDTPDTHRGRGPSRSRLIAAPRAWCGGCQSNVEMSASRPSRDVRAISTAAPR